MFDGQGLPEAFREGLLPPGPGGRSDIPGVGVVTEEADPEQDGSGQVRGKQVESALQWEIESDTRPRQPIPARGEYDHPPEQDPRPLVSRTSVSMAAVQPLFGGGSLRIVKTVSLRGSVVRCGTEVELVEADEAAEVSLSWFAHPFFPLTEDGRVCTFAFDTDLDEGEERSFFYDSQRQLMMDKSCATGPQTPQSRALQLTLCPRRQLGVRGGRRELQAADRRGGAAVVGECVSPAWGRGGRRERLRDGDVSDLGVRERERENSLHILWSRRANVRWRAGTRRRSASSPTSSRRWRLARPAHGRSPTTLVRS